jgi:hypothetical protein
MRRTNVWILVLLLVAWLPGAAMAGADLAKVQVKGEAPDAVAAQRMALAQGEAEAFLEVLRRRDAKRADEIFAKVTPAQRAQLVKSVSVEQENARAGRYEALVTYVFQESAIDALMREQKGMGDEVEGRGLLVLPLYYDGQKLLLWEPENFWRSTLARLALERGKGRLIVPFGDKRDNLVASVQAVVGGAKEPLLELARRYGTPQAAIVTGQIVDLDGKRVAEVRLRRPGQNAEEEIVRHYPAQDTAESPELLLKRAGAETVQQLLATEQQFSVFAAKGAEKLKGRVVRAEFPRWNEWQTIRTKLEGLPGVEFVDIGAISAGYAQVTLYYRGEEDPITQALKTRGLRVATGGEYWTLSLE